MPFRILAAGALFSRGSLAAEAFIGRSASPDARFACRRVRTGNFLPSRGPERAPEKKKA